MLIVAYKLDTEDHVRVYSEVWERVCCKKEVNRKSYGIYKSLIVFVCVYSLLPMLSFFMFTCPSR